MAKETTDYIKRAPDTKCNAWMPKKQRYCLRPAGAKTDHPGSGRCSVHGGALSSTKTILGLQSQIILNHPRIQALREMYEALPDPLSAERELALQRAIMHDFLERFEAFQAALLAWHESYLQGASEAESLKPRQIMDISEAYNIVESVTRIIARIEKARAENAVSRPDLLRALGNMARVVELYVKDDRVLEKIRDGWRDIHV